MFDTLFTHEPSLERYRAAPLYDERVQYLQHCMDSGFRRSVLTRVAVCQLRLVGLLQLKGRETLNVSQVEAAAQTWSQPGMLRSEFGGAASTKAEFVHHSVRWLQFLGWLDEAAPVPPHPHTAAVATFAEWARTERGYSEPTIDACCGAADEFLVFFASARPDTPLAEVHITDVDRAFIAKAARRTLSRWTMAGYAQRLRVFFRFAEARGWCMRGIADAIKAPRIYTDEQLLPRLTRDQVLRLLATTEGDRRSDIRDRAILMLLTTYGIRSGELRRLRLDDIDWRAETLRVRRSKSSRTHWYPLSPSVAHAIVRYIREVRPSRPDRILFYTLVAPIGPLDKGGLGSIVRNRLRRVGIVTGRRGPHALRHATAQHLRDQDMSWKAIGDLLGHTSPASTMTYAKVDIKSLREVAEGVDLEGLA